MTKTLESSTKFNRLANRFFRALRENDQTEKMNARDALIIYCMEKTDGYTYCATDWAYCYARFFTFKDARAIFIDVWNRAIAENVLSTYITPARENEVCTTIDGSHADGRIFNLRESEAIVGK